ncbi:Structural maintenance of chromosomes protein 6, partial [Cryomyces antarcticus]
RLGQLGKQLKDEVDAAQKAIDETVARINKAEAKVQKAAQKRQDALYEKNNAYARIEDAKSDKVRVENARQRQADKVASFEIDAGQISARVAVDPGETPTTLDAKLMKLQKDLERYQQELGGTREELNEGCVEAEIKYKTAKKQLDDLYSLSQSLKFTLVDRKSRWLKFRRFISSRARIMFVYLLSEREFRGKLVANHEHQELDISIEPDISRNSDKGRQTKTLSGGEKSFSTICLLLSLWDAMGSPIRCLDEFDVFMDNVNRDVSMKMMIGAARRSVSRQFILITPQAMGNVQLQEDVNIIKWVYT